MNGTAHHAQREAAAAYVIGALPADERLAFEEHLAGCAECEALVRALAGVAQALPYALPQIAPPASLRARVLAAIGAPPAAHRIVPSRPWLARAGWLSAAALLVMSAALTAYVWSLRARMDGLDVQLRAALERLDRTEQQLAVATQAQGRAQRRLAVLTAPDLEQVDLAGQAPAPRAAGRAFISRASGLLFAATGLPVPPAGRTYQLWLLTSDAPVSAGLLKPDADGRVAAGFDTPAAPGRPTGLAVSIEPDGGVAAPTGAIYLAGRSH